MASALVVFTRTMERDDGSIRGPGHICHCQWHPREDMIRWQEGKSEVYVVLVSSNVPRLQVVPWVHASACISFTSSLSASLPAAATFVQENMIMKPKLVEEGLWDEGMQKSLQRLRKGAFTRPNGTRMETIDEVLTAVGYYYHIKVGLNMPGCAARVHTGSVDRSHIHRRLFGC